MDEGKWLEGEVSLPISLNELVERASDRHGGPIYLKRTVSPRACWCPRNGRNHPLLDVPSLNASLSNNDGVWPPLSFFRTPVPRVAATSPTVALNVPAATRVWIWSPA